MGAIRPGGEGLYAALEDLLKKAGRDGKPLTAVDLYTREHQKIYNNAEDVNRVSDVLGHLWRRGVINRTPAPKSVNSQARYAYYWPPEKAHPAQVPDAKVLLHRPSIEVTEEGNHVRISLPHLEISIKVRG